METNMTLADLCEGETGIVVRLQGDSTIRQRLMDMGVVRGTEVRVERYAPLYDPIAIKIKGNLLAIRVAEGKMIEVVRPVSDCTDK
jgi:ferrous iron transport protein A